MPIRFISWERGNSLRGTREEVVFYQPRVPNYGNWGILRRADFVVVALPLTDANEGILGEEERAMMKENAHLISVSRGPLVQEEALLKVLKHGAIAGAVLDVFHEEELPRDHPLWDLDKVIITPHISGPIIPEDIAKIFIENLRRFEEGKKLEGVVDHEEEY